MEEKRLEVPYIVYEGEQARHERTIRRLIIALVVSVVIIFLSNAAWLLYMSGYDIYTDDSDITIESRDGIANYIGQDGVIGNGTDSSTTETAGNGQEKWQVEEETPLIYHVRRSSI